MNMSKYFGRGPEMSKADRILGRTPSDNNDHRMISQSSSKAERILGIGQYDNDNDMSKADRVLGRKGSDTSKADRVLGRFGGTRRGGKGKKLATKKRCKKSVKRTRRR